jgi:hypothetical protein
MHAYRRPSIEITTVWEIKDLFSVAGISDGFRSQYFYYVPDFVWPTLEAAIASFRCKGCYQNHSMSCENVGAERPLPHWILCNSDAWTLYVLMVILGQHLIGGLWFHKVSSPFINGQTTPTFCWSNKILWVWCWGLEREGCSRVNLCQQCLIA